ncbi:MAG TPA: helix-turn-helix transcriptional regulator [Brevundimonas sp.]|nr:helix-turn-helix transcriptional regulator [Brevundimonas sp.]
MTVHGFPSADPDQVALGARLKRWRSERATGVEALAEAIGMSAAELRLVEAGRARMTSAQVSAATRVLGLPIWALTSDTAAH